MTACADVATRAEDERLNLLLELSAMLASEVALDDLLRRTGERIARALCAERATVWLLDSQKQRLRSEVADLPEAESLTLSVNRGIAGHVARTGDVMKVDDVRADARWSPEIDIQTGYTTRSVLAAPIPMRAGPRCGVLQVLNKIDGPFTAADRRYLTALAEHVGRAIDYTSLRPRDASGVVVRGTINRVVGSSAAMSGVYELLLRTAPTDAAVLLTGETGTGKGLIARAIHANSDRRDGPLVQVDCTTLPAGLVESELFGHERGAYTGADRQTVGKVERARGGTLFIDEIGELPLELQGKLLRFLQEQTFERVGGTAALEADVRIVCATNRDLALEVQRGTFRQDLYYRIKVVEIELPPLRARGADDIETLAEHFATQYARKHGKPVPSFETGAMDRLIRHDYPGNVRELEHIIERAVVLTDGHLSPNDLGVTTHHRPSVPDCVELPPGLELDDAVRQYAADALRRQAGNRSQTARLLGISRNRLARILAI